MRMFTYQPPPPSVPGEIPPSETTGPVEPAPDASAEAAQEEARTSWDVKDHVKSIDVDVVDVKIQI